MTHSNNFDAHHYAIRIADQSAHRLEGNMHGGFDYGAVYGEIGRMRLADTVGGRLDGELFRLQVNEMDRVFHRDGYLPHLHIRLDERCNPLMVPDEVMGGPHRSQSMYGPFHLGRYKHSMHHHLPPDLQLCGGSGSITPEQCAAMTPAVPDVEEVPMDDPGAAMQINAPAGGGGDNAYMPVLYGGDTGSASASLPNMSIDNMSSGGVSPGQGGTAVNSFAPDQGSVDNTVTSQAHPDLSTSQQIDIIARNMTTQSNSDSAGASPVTAENFASPAGGQSGLDQGIPPDRQASDGPSPDAPRVVPVAKVPDAQLTMTGAPTITPEKIDEVLKAYHSPAAGMGKYIYDEGVKHGINPAMALAFYCVESQCGTKGLAVQNKSWGNVRGHGPLGYRPFNSIKESLDHWYNMIENVYLGKFHADKLSKVISHYAPDSDGNNEKAYVRSVGSLLRKWQA